MIGLYSNRIGCFGSIVLSIVATVLLALVVRASERFLPET